MGNKRPWALAVVAGLLLAAACVAVTGLSAVAAKDEGRAELAAVCQEPGSWIDPASGERLGAPALMARLARKDVVLLGESHTNMEHHRWQLQMLAGLQAHRADLVVGFEMFPRAVQPALDAWPAGGLTEEGFLEGARWREVWGYDADLYLPIFHFVRQNRLPMVALNVDRGLIGRVGAEGWDAVPAAEREGLSDPAPATEAYQRSLAEVFQAKMRMAAAGQSVGQAGHGSGDGADGDEITIDAILEREGFQRFVQAQLTWDRAMAEAIAAARRARPEALVVGVLGRGHIEHGFGVPHQLADLGVKGAAVLLPVETGAACESLAADVADAVFLVAPTDEMPAPAGPRLGVVIESVDSGVRVLQVVDDSVAETAGLAAGDVIVSAASFPLAETGDLIAIIQRQAPGTWLPLAVSREGEAREVVAKFPKSFE